MTEKLPINLADVARSLEGDNRHLGYAKECVEAGWNARDERGRAFNFQAALSAIQAVITEHEFLIDRLYDEAKPKKK